MTTTDGIYVDATQIAAGDMSGPTSAQMVLKNPAIDYAVLETARGGILRSGLGFDRCDVAVVTNVTSDHLGLNGINTLAELARVKEVVPQSVLPDGASVLNADNPYTVEMARVARGEIIFFSMDEENPVIRDHLRERGKAVVLRPTRHGEMITLIEHRRDTSLLLAEEIPATMDGRIRVNIQNAMAAAAAAFAQDVQLEYIRNALRTFTSSFFQTPGSLQPARDRRPQGAPRLLPQRGRAGVDGRFRQAHGRRPHHRHDRHAGRPQRRGHHRLRPPGGRHLRRDRHPRGRQSPRPPPRRGGRHAARRHRRRRPDDGKVDIVLDEMEAARDGHRPRRSATTWSSSSPTARRRSSSS